MPASDLYKNFDDLKHLDKEWEMRKDTFKPSDYVSRKYQQEHKAYLRRREELTQYQNETGLQKNI